jgi:hypothetical protein
MDNVSWSMGLVVMLILFEVGLKASLLDHKFKKTMIDQIVIIQTQELKCINL